MRIRPENASRKIDQLGRVTIPKGLRDRMNLQINDNMELFTMESEGREYICLSKESSEKSKYEFAAAVLEELGVQDLPEELVSVLM